jgi:hypothetical protein
MVEPRCFVNQIFGGGVFVCKRPVATANGFCAFHGKPNAITADLELTWRAWLRKHFIFGPRNLWRAVRLAPRQIRFWWSMRKHPLCTIQGCEDRAMYAKGGKCINHYMG